MVYDSQAGRDNNAFPVMSRDHVWTGPANLGFLECELEGGFNDSKRFAKSQVSALSPQHKS